MSQDEGTVSLYVGQTQTLFDLGPAGFKDFASAWEAESKKHTDKVVKAAIENLEKERDQELATLNERITQAVADSDFDLVTELAILRANVSKEYETRVDTARLIPLSKSFETVCSTYGIVVRKPSGNSTQGLEVNKVYRVTRYERVRYYLVTEDSVACYASNGNSSDHIFTLTADTWEKLYPYAMSSLTKLGMVHDSVYHKDSKLTGTVLEKLTAIEGSLPDWHKVVGLNSVTSNGVNSITTLDKTPEEWLKENPPEKESPKKK